MKTIKDIQVLKGVRALVRVDFNVPVKNGSVVDDFRIKKALTTINYLKEKGARTILISHIERGPNDPDKSEPTLAPVADCLNKMGVKCTFVENYRNATAAVEAMADGDCILLENLRINEGEKKNDKKFAKELASLADLYIDDAFAVAHRAHASIVAITEFLPSYMGFLLEDEVKHLSAAFHPKRPFLFILCGAKFETKLPLIEKFMGIADHVFVGGALANNFFKEKGMEIGQSLISAQNFDLKRFYDDPIFSKKLLLPVDVVVLCKDGKKVIKKPEAVAADENIVDAGPDTVAMLGTKINAAAEILWNGPLGAYENGFKEPTLALAHLIADRTLAGAESIVGGGDTLATIADMQKPANGDPTESQFTFISTGGGAMLDYLANESLPGLDALENSKT